MPGGRPPSLYGIAASASLTVRVTPAVRLELERLAAGRGTSIPGVLREAIDEMLDGGFSADASPRAGVFRLRQDD